MSPSPRRRRPNYWKDAIEYLSERDEVLRGIIRQYDGETLLSRGSAFYSLARAIIGQQISVKAADSIWKRFEETAGAIDPASIAALSEESMRACGLSGQKVTYLHDLARFFTERPSPNWQRRNDEVILKELMSIKGIGRWSGEMFLIFHMLRPDVFPVADIGLRKAVQKYYNNGEPLTTQEIISHGDRWRPYRTVATWYLWRSLDPVPVEY